MRVRNIPQGVHTSIKAGERRRITMDNGNIDSLKLPQTVVGRLIKDTLPAGVNVSKVEPTFHLNASNSPA